MAHRQPCKGELDREFDAIAARLDLLEEALGALLDAQSKPKTQKADKAKEPK